MPGKRRHEFFRIIAYQFVKKPGFPWGCHVPLDMRRNLQLAHIRFSRARGGHISLPPDDLALRVAEIRAVDLADFLKPTPSDGMQTFVSTGPRIHAANAVPKLSSLRDLSKLW